MNTTDNELEDQYAPSCPVCGEKATFRDAMGVFWDSNAHHWIESFKEETAK